MGEGEREGGSIRPRLTYANVVSTLCLFLLLGGVAVAAFKLPKNSVGPRQLKKNAVNGTKVADGSLTNLDIKGPVDSATDAAHAAEAAHAANAEQLGGLGPASFFPSGNVKRGGLFVNQGIGGSRTDPLLTIGPLNLSVTCTGDMAGNDTLTLNASTTGSSAAIWWSYTGIGTFETEATPHTGSQGVGSSPVGLFDTPATAYIQSGVGQLNYSDSAVDIIVPVRFENGGDVVGGHCSANAVGFST